MKTKRLSPEKFFVSKKGYITRNKVELALFLDEIDDDEFKSHVTKTKNDFSNWILEVYNDEHLASEISKLNNKKDIQIELLKSIVFDRMKKQKAKELNKI